MRAWVVGAACALGVVPLGACTSLLGDFQTGDSTDGGPAGDAMGADGAGGDATVGEAGEGGAGEAGPSDDGGADAAAEASLVDNYAAPDHSAPPEAGTAEAGMDAGVVHGNGTFQPVTDIVPLPGSNLGPSTLDGSAGPAPTGLIAADLNNDGLPDLAGCNGAGIFVLLSQKDGSFKQAETSDNSISNCVGLAAADLTKAGYPNLVVIQSSPPELYVFTNQGGVNFYIAASQFTTGPTVIPLSGAPQFVAADDFDQDPSHLPDVVVSVGGSLQLYQDTYPGTFGLAFDGTVAVSDAPGKVVFGDVHDRNGGGVLDAIVGAAAWDAYAFAASSTTPYFSGAAALRYAYNPPSPLNLQEVTTGDFDGDGWLDVAAADQGPNDVTPFFNLCSGSCPSLNFQGATQAMDPPHIHLNGAPRDIASGDFNGDGRSDLVVSVAGGQLGLITSLPGRTFSSSVRIPVNGDTSSVVVADFNGDHKPDIAALYTTKAAVAVLFGN